MRVTFSSFGGLIPRRSDHALPAVSATVAHDVKLRNGRIEAWHNPAFFGRAVDYAKSFYVYDCCLLSWTGHVQVAELGAVSDAAYLVGRTGELEAVTAQDCVPEYISLALPAPTVQPQVTGGDYCGRDYDVRSYVYTYVNKFGDESPPSPPSYAVTVQDGDPVVVSGIPIPDPKYGVEAVNIYRTATGFRPADGKMQEKLTDFLYVTTIPAASGGFTDSTPLRGLGPALDTTVSTQRCAPSGMGNLVSIDARVQLAATKGNKVYLSENEHLLNWPVESEITLDSRIVHMGQKDQILYVTTETTPYIIKVPCEGVPQVKDLGFRLPDIAEQSNCAAVMTPHGFVYSSWIGLILILPNGDYRVITAPWFSEDDWRALSPQTVRLAYWEGYVFCATDTMTFMLDIDGDTYGDVKLGELVTLSDRPIDMRTTNTGQLAMLIAVKIKEDEEEWIEWHAVIWDNGESLRDYEWTSRELTGGSNRAASTTDFMKALASSAAQNSSTKEPMGCMWSPASAKIRTIGVQFTLTTPVPGHPGYTRWVSNEVPFRLPRLGRHMYYKVTLKGTAPVEYMDLGTAHFTVNEGE